MANREVGLNWINISETSVCSNLMKVILAETVFDVFLKSHNFAKVKSVPVPFRITGVYNEIGEKNSKSKATSFWVKYSQ